MSCSCSTNNLQLSDRPFRKKMKGHCIIQRHRREKSRNHKPPQKKQKTNLKLPRACAAHSSCSLPTDSHRTSRAYLYGPTSAQESFPRALYKSEDASFVKTSSLVSDSDSEKTDDGVRFAKCEVGDWWLPVSNKLLSLTPLKLQYIFAMLCTISSDNLLALCAGSLLHLNPRSSSADICDSDLDKKSSWPLCTC